MRSSTPRDPQLQCRDCRRVYPLGALFTGCPHCAGSDAAGALEVVYDYEHWRDEGALGRWAGRAGVWAYRELLPLPLQDSPVTLCEGGTPLFELATSGPGRIFVKDESRNPTGAHKDRFHTVSVSMARYLDFHKISASTTGNHGYSLAAY